VRVAERGMNMMIKTNVKDVKKENIVIGERISYVKDVQKNMGSQWKGEIIVNAYIHIY
jgi:hypothetical protein